MRLSHAHMEKVDNSTRPYRNLMFRLFTELPERLRKACGVCGTQVSTPESLTKNNECTWGCCTHRLQDRNDDDLCAGL